MEIDDNFNDDTINPKEFLNEYKYVFDNSN